MDSSSPTNSNNSRYRQKRPKNASLLSEQGRPDDQQSSMSLRI